jgi:hypothetical protein
MSNRQKALLAAGLSAAVLLSSATIAGVVFINMAINRSVASVGGCPSNLFPIRPGSRLHDHSEITIGTTTGCWSTYDERNPVSETDVFRYYVEPSHTPGWTLQESYENTRYAAFRNNKDPDVQADVSVWTFRTFFLVGPSTTRLDISICRCDPRSMAQ